ncbi:MAG TPA: LEA type 2 family protein [Gallionella sp.]|nr:LEA type 2 family protein [Gallionella sp.]
MNCGTSLLMLCCTAFLVAGCTTLSPGFETPSVDVTSFRMLPSQTITPRFEIGMRIVNPNAVKLNLRGISYKIFLNGYQVVEGAANELPVVPAYGEAEFKVTATVGLIESMRFVSDLLQNARGQVAYRLDAKLDIGALIPSLRVEKAGSFTPD